MKRINFKMYSKLICISLILFLTFFINLSTISAQTEITPGSPTPTPSPSSTFNDSKIILSNDQNNEFELLKTKLDTVSDFNDKIISNVQWLIGLVLAAVTLILGGNWFTTYRQNKIDLENYKNLLLNNIEKASETTNENLNNELENRILKFTEQLNKKVDQIEKQHKSKIDGYFENVKKDIISLQRQQLKSEATRVEREGIYTTATRIYTDLIKLDPDYFDVGDYLKSLINAIRKVDELQAYHISDIKKALRLLGDDYKDISEQITSLMNEKL